MLSIEDIKKACEFAKGFEIRYGCLVTPNGLNVGLNAIEHETKMAYPLFLQRVIEGINKDYLLDLKGLYVEFKSFGLWVYDDNYNIVFERDFIRTVANGFDPDQAKEQTIKYILERI